MAAKNRGAGYLAPADDQDAFLDTIFSRCCCKVSIKTRIGKLDPAEWETILSIYEKYPVEELVLHPRIQQDFYKHPVRMEAYRYACEHSHHSLCCNRRPVLPCRLSGILPDISTDRKNHVRQRHSYRIQALPLRCVIQDRLTSTYQRASAAFP